MPPGHRTARRRHRRAPARGRLLVVALTSGVLVGAVGLGAAGDAAPAPVAERSRQARPPGTAGPLGTARPDGTARPRGTARQPGLEVLRAWDGARSAAYALGSVAALRKLYADGAGGDDVRLLRSYLDRGYRVEGLRMQLLAVTVRDHEPGTWLLRVTDRLVGGAAVGHGARIALPRDRASTRTVRLERDAAGRWRVLSVRG